MTDLAVVEHLHNWDVSASFAKFDDVERVAWLEQKNQEMLKARSKRYARGVLQRLGLKAPPEEAHLELADFLRLGYEPDEDGLWDKGNILLNAGINRMGSLLIAAGGQGYTNTYTRLGTGNGSTAVAATDTDLSAAAGSANRWFRAADATYPTFATQTLTLVATFPTADGNYNWLEWGIDQGGAGSSTSSATVGAPMLNRKVPASSLGTKASGASWALTVTIVIS